MGLGLGLQKELGQDTPAGLKPLLSSFSGLRCLSLVAGPNWPQEKLPWSGKLHFSPTLIWSQRTEVSRVVCKGLHPTKGSW